MARGHEWARLSMVGHRSFVPLEKPEGFYWTIHDTVQGNSSCESRVLRRR